MVDPNACECSLATRAVGDGCQHCNPAKTIELLEEQIAELRLTAEEREAVEIIVGLYEERIEDDKIADVQTAKDRISAVRAFLKRHGGA